MAENTASNGTGPEQGSQSTGNTGSTGTQASGISQQSGGTQQQASKDKNQQQQKSSTGFDYNNPEFQRFIQSEIDRATNKLGNDNKQLRTQLENLQNSKMTDDERREAELADRERKLNEREAEVKTEKNRMYALSKIKAAGLDDGSETALGLIDLVMADDEKGIDGKVTTLDTLVKKLVETQVNKAFAANGRQPGSSNYNGAKDTNKNTAAIDAGKKAAAVNKQAKSILNYYTGGKE